MILNGQVEDELCEALFAKLHSTLKEAGGSHNFEVRDGSHLKLEAKFGTIIDRNTNLRVELPVCSECRTQSLAS